MEHYTETIKEDFTEYLRDWYEPEEDFDEFKDEYIEENFNSWMRDTFNCQYADLVYFMGIIHAEEIGDGFTAWNSPQKIFEVGMYFLARDVINEMTLDFIQDEAEPVIVEDDATILNRAQ